MGFLPVGVLILYDTLAD